MFKVSIKYSDTDKIERIIEYAINGEFNDSIMVYHLILNEFSENLIIRKVNHNIRLRKDITFECKDEEDYIFLQMIV